MLPRSCYAISSTELAYAATSLPGYRRGRRHCCPGPTLCPYACYAMSLRLPALRPPGTDIAYASPRHSALSPVWCARCGTGIAYAATRDA
eukprot:3512819-Rhodomonas_salina.1